MDTERGSQPGYDQENMHAGMGVESDPIPLEDLVEFADNPEPRCPCVLLLDTSQSMGFIEAIGPLNEGVEVFKTELEKDSLASLRVEVAVVAFGTREDNGNGVEVVHDFATVDNFEPPRLEAEGLTPMGAGINKALDLIEDRKRSYRESGIGYYRPWVFMITDGLPTDEAEGAFRRVAREEDEKRVAFFAVGVAGADMEYLNQRLTRSALPLRGLSFGEMFVWLSSSMSRVSNSRTDDEIQLDTDGLKGWAAI